MKRTDNPELTRIMLDHLATLYKMREKRVGIHLSTLVQCITRSFLDYKTDPDPTDEEVMIFALGYGLQDILTPKAATTPIYQKDGITYSPDFEIVLAQMEGSVELKTTRTSTDKPTNESWLVYMMGGCFIRGDNIYHLGVLHMLGNYHPPFPQMLSTTFEFDEEEIMDNWAYLMYRKFAYELSLLTDEVPEPYKWCYGWECNYCRHKLTCQAIVWAREREQK